MHAPTPSQLAVIALALAVALGAAACDAAPPPRLTPAPSSSVTSTPVGIAPTAPTATASPTRAPSPSPSPSPPPSPPPSPTQPPPPGFAWSTSASPDGAWHARFGLMDNLHAPDPSSEYATNMWSYSALILESVDGARTFPVVADWAPYMKCAENVVDFLGWSPDSRYAFFARHQLCAGGCMSPVGSTVGLSRVDLASGAVASLPPNGSGDIALGRASLSPDARWIAIRPDTSTLPDEVFAIRLVATGDDDDRVAEIDLHRAVFPERDHTYIHGPWSIEWAPDTSYVRFQFTNEVCSERYPIQNGWLRYDLETGALSPEAPLLDGMPLLITDEGG